MTSTWNIFYFYAYFLSILSFYKPFVLTFLYGLGMTLLTHYLAERMRANPKVGRVLEKVAGIFLVGFGIKLAISK